MPLSRAASPTQPRAALLGHELVVECRAGGEQDVEARLWVLEQQREDDHRHFLEIRDHCLKLCAGLDRKSEKEVDTPRYFQELAARGLQFQQALALH